MASVLKLPQNAVGVDWFCSDIQGCYDQLIAALKLADFNVGSDRLISCGDLVDRGRKNYSVVKLFADSSWFHSIASNHDLLTGLWARGDESLRRIIHQIGGGWQFDLPPERRKLVADAFADLPAAIEVIQPDGQRFVCAHAEIPYSVDWPRVTEVRLTADEAQEFGDPVGSDFLWGRSRACYAWRMWNDPEGASVPDWALYEGSLFLAPINGAGVTVFGHSTCIPPHPVFVGSHRFIDTGAEKRDGRLTLWCPAINACVYALSDGTVYKAEAPKVLPIDPAWRPSGDRLERLKLAFQQEMAERAAAARIAAGMQLSADDLKWLR